MVYFTWHTINDNIVDIPIEPDSLLRGVELEMKNYEIRNEENIIVGFDLLFMFYGNLWESILDRLDHQYDGHVSTIQHEGHKYRIYRKI